MTNAGYLPAHHTDTDNPSVQVQPHRPLLPSSAVFTHAEDEEERVRDDHTTCQDTGVHKDVARNKQADVSNEVGGFEHSEEIWVIPSDKSLTGRAIQFNHRHR